MKVGDIVKLKSGGPWLTVTGLHADERSCFVNWFNDGTLERASLAIEALTVFQPDSVVSVNFANVAGFTAA